jgi:hypothetical protein
MTFPLVLSVAYFSDCTWATDITTDIDTTMAIVTIVIANIAAVTATAISIATDISTIAVTAGSIVVRTDTIVAMTDVIVDTTGGTEGRSLMLWNLSTREHLLGAVLILALSGSGAGAAEETTRLTQSVEGPKSSLNSVQSEQLETSPVDEAPALKSDGSRQEAANQQRLTAHPLGRSFSIFDAQSVISRDDDGDGFYHRIRVDFDADVDSGDAWVYAKLYLSLEGGPWNLYYTTSSFQIEDDLSDDAYTVTTRLLDGYPTGYYDVLIELYDADYDLLEVNYGPFEDEDLAVLPLEDFYRDDYYDDGGGGAMGPMLLLLALMGIGRSCSLRRRGGNLRL